MKITTDSAALLVGINLVLIRIKITKKLLGKRKLLFKMDKLKAIVLYLSLVNKASNKIAEVKQEGKAEGEAKGKEEGLAEGFARGVDMKNKKSLALNRKKI